MVVLKRKVKASVYPCAFDTQRSSLIDKVQPCHLLLTIFYHAILRPMISHPLHSYSLSSSMMDQHPKTT